MDSASSAAGGSGFRVAPAERPPLPPVVGDSRAAAYAEAGVTVDPAARVAATAELLPGARVRGGAVVSEMCLVGSNALVADGARLDAWCVVGDRAVIGPGAWLGSGTSVDADSTVGSRGRSRERPVQVAPGVHVRAGAHVQGPQAVWPDHPAAGPRDTETPARADVALGVAAPSPAGAPAPAAGASAAAESRPGPASDRSR